MPCARSRPIRNAQNVCEQDLITLWMCSETEKLLVIVIAMILIVVKRCIPGNGGGWVVERSSYSSCLQKLLRLSCSG